jgi:hypothetical protein
MIQCRRYPQEGYFPEATFLYRTEVLFRLRKIYQNKSKSFSSCVSFNLPDPENPEEPAEPGDVDTEGKRLHVSKKVTVTKRV